MKKSNIILLVLGIVALFVIINILMFCAQKNLTDALLNDLNNMNKTSVDNGLKECKNNSLGEACYFILAISSHKAEGYTNGILCNNVTDKDLNFICIALISQLNNNTEVCEQLSDPAIVQTCKASVTDDINYCNEIEETKLRSDCLEAMGDKQTFIWD